MREYKYKVWDEADKKMSQVVSLDEIVSSTPEELFGKYLWHPYTWLEYTGLKDKNGVEIYAGDIMTNSAIKERFLPYIVKFGEHTDIAEAGCTRHSNIGFYIQDATGGQVGLLNEELLLDWGGFEVIGNTYENKELLNEQRNKV